MDIVELAIRTASRRNPKIIRGTLQHILPNKSRRHLVKQIFQLLKKMTTKIITTDEHPNYLRMSRLRDIQKIYIVYFLCTVVV